MKNKSNGLMVIHNSFINARMELKSSEELKIMTYAISCIEKDAKKFKDVFINIDDYMKKTEKRKDYRQVLEVGQSLSRKHITIFDENNLWTVYSLFDFIQLESPGVLRIKFNQSVKPFLIGLKKSYTKVLLTNIAPLSSKYAIQIYMLLKEKHQMFKTERKFDLVELQKALMCPKSQRDNYKEFRKQALNIAIKEINEHTDIEIGEIIPTGKKGRKISEITAYFKQRTIDYKNIDLSSLKAFKTYIRHKYENKPAFKLGDTQISDLRGIRYSDDFIVSVKNGLLKSNISNEFIKTNEANHIFNEMYKYLKQIKKHLVLNKK